MAGGTTPTYGTSGSDFTLGGLTINGSGGASKLKGLGVIYGGTVTINGVGSGNGLVGAKHLTYIEGTRVTVSGTASVFAGSLMLRATGNSSVTLGANLTTSGTIRFNATNLILASNVTTAGGAVTIALGSGVYNTGSGYILTTSNQNLNLMAGSVTGAANDATVFDLGTGTITASAAVTAAAAGASSKKFYDYDDTAVGKKGVTEIGSVDPNDAAITDWKFYGTSAGTAAANTAWMNNATLTAAKVVKVETFTSDSKAGLDTANVVGGIVKFKVKTAAGSPSTTVVDLTATGKAVTFSAIGAAGAVAVGTLPTAASVVFSGANNLTGNVTLNATGSITQATGATLSITGGNLIVSGSSAITLTNAGNALGSFGSLELERGDCDYHWRGDDSERQYQRGRRDRPDRDRHDSWLSGDDQRRSGDN